MDFSFQGSDNKRYHLAELTLGNIATDLPLWVQFRAYEKFKLMKDKLPPDLYEQESTRLLLECSKLNYDANSPEVNKYLNGMEGACYMIYLSLKKNHTDISFEQVQELITMNNLPEVQIKIAVLAGETDEATAKKKLETLDSTKGSS